VDALNIGLDLCTNELIFRMDSDDIMFPERIQKQITFMEKNPQCMILGTQIQEFKFINEIISYKPIHSMKKHQDFISWMHFLQFPSNWFMNHPTLCYRKQAIERIGKYNSNDSIIKYSAMEYWELELRFLKIFGAVYNLQEPLVYYRVHDNQHSKNNKDINVDGTKKYIIQNIILQ